MALGLMAGDATPQPSRALIEAGVRSAAWRFRLRVAGGTNEEHLALRLLLSIATLAEIVQQLLEPSI